MSDKSKHTTTTHTTTTTTPITSGSVTKDLHDMRVSGAHESAKKDAIASEKWESAKENARIAKEASKQAAIDAAEASSNKIGARKDGAKETVAAAGEKVIETKETAKELAKDVKDKVVEKAEQAREAVAEAYDRTADEINDANARAKQNMAAERERASRVTPTVTHHTVTTTSKPVVSDVRDRPSGFPQHQHHTSTTTPATTQTIPKAPPLPASNISHKSTTSTATSVSTGQPVSEKVKDKAADLLDKAGAKVEQGKQQVYEAADQTKKSAEGAFNSGRQLLQDARDTIVGSTHNMVKEGQKSAQDASTQIRYASDRSAEAATDLRSKMIETKEQARQLAHDTLEKAREKMEPAADSSDKLAQQRGIQKAQETEHHAASLLERVKDSVSHLFDAGRHAVMDAVNPEAEDEDLVVPKTGFVTTSTTSSDLEPRVPVPASETSAHATRGSSLGMSSSDAAGREAANVASRPLTQMQTSDLRDAFGSGSGGSSSLMEKDKDKSVGSERADKHMERLEAGDYKVE